MRGINQQVKQILAVNKEARDSDKELIRAFFASHGVYFTPQQEEVLFSVSMESITRARRDIQEQGLYPASEGVRRMRHRKASLIRKTSKVTQPAEIIEASPQQLFDDKQFKGIF